MATAAVARRRRAEPEVRESSRAHDAHQLRLAGLDWATIAQRVGYADGGVASAAVTAYMQSLDVEAGPDARRRALDLELQRLDQLQAAYWPAALNGDLPS